MIVSRAQESVFKRLLNEEPTMRKTEVEYVLNNLIERYKDNIPFEKYQLLIDIGSILFSQAKHIKSNSGLLEKMNEMYQTVHESFFKMDKHFVEYMSFYL